MPAPKECRVCGSTTTSDLFLSGCCQKMAFCLVCSQSMRANKEPCLECGGPITNAVKVFEVVVAPPSNRQILLSRFQGGKPDFKNNSKWSLNRPEGKDDELVLESGEHKYHGRTEVARPEPSHVDYLFFPNFDDWTIQARPVDAIYDFTKTSIVPVGDQKTLKEAELLLRKRKQTVEGCAKRMKLKGIVGETNSLSSSDEDGSKGDGLDFDEKFSDDDVDMGQEDTDTPPLSPPPEYHDDGKKKNAADDDEQQKKA